MIITIRFTPNAKIHTDLIGEECADGNMRIDVPDNDRVVGTGIGRGYP